MAHDEHSKSHGYVPDKDAYLKRLRRIEGQVRGIARMVDEDTYCIDVLTQVAAVTKALHAVSLGLVGDHLGHCVVDAAKESDEAAAAKVEEATQAIGRANVGLIRLSRYRYRKGQAASGKYTAR